MIISIPDWLERHYLPCLFKKLTGIDCPGCGTQRALIELLRGNLNHSFAIYPSLIPLLVMFAFMLFHLIVKLKNGHIILKMLFILNMLIISFSYIYKMT